MSCLNPLDPQSARIYTTDGVFATLSHNGGKAGLFRAGILQPVATSILPV